MAWERQKAYIADTPIPPQTKSWFFAVVIAIIASVVLFMLHASDKLYILQRINIWIITLTPAACWIIAFSLRCYLFGRELSDYYFLRDEAQTAQLQWQQWAERYIAVIGHTILLPDKITVSFLAQDTKDFPVQYSLTKRIDYLPKKRNAEYHATLLLMSSIEDKLNKLPSDLALNATILTDGGTEEQKLLQEAFLESWSTIAPTRPLPAKISLKTTLPYDVIDAQLKSKNMAADLLLIYQRQGEDDYSDTLGIFLFTTDDVAQKYELPVKGRLLRPMKFNASSLSSDLKIFVETQVLSQQAKGIIGDGVALTSLTSQIFPTMAIFGSPLTTDNIFIQERFTGMPGPFSDWLTAGLGLDFSCQQSAPYLVFTQADKNWLISTVSTGSNNEIV